VTAIEDVLWPGMKALEPTSLLSGTLANKPGYHNSRNRLPATDYSVAQFAIDRQGPANEGSAIDWTFPDAQRGDYRTIAKYSKRLLDAGMRGDPRTQYMREFFGNADLDTVVEGWDFAKKRSATSDDSHLWHIHISIHRKYINVPAAMRSILQILSGEPARVYTYQNITGSLPVLKYGDSDDSMGGYNYVRRVQGFFGLTRDGDYGPLTRDALKDAFGGDGLTVDINTWRQLCAIRPAVPGTVRR